MYPRALAKRTATSRLPLPVKTAWGPRPPDTLGVYPGRRLVAGNGVGRLYCILFVLFEDTLYNFLLNK